MMTARRHCIRVVTFALASLLLWTLALGQALHPLKPADRSSPRAALAFPSQTLYLGRDRDNDSIKAPAGNASRQGQDKGVIETTPAARTA